ncbi:hypothetical protein C5167_039125 [Papaver somniferum]|uniref:Uncharacterized protein n=1 Tax=Papaver somniferum TaxID=3469 RepID=A0A4Y7IEJ7_PAPSO|nr:hypothetical protein C5167_039125 [Papaver somniferum]
MEKTSLLTFMTGLKFQRSKKKLKSLSVWVEKKIHEKWNANKRNMMVQHCNEEKIVTQNKAKEVIDTKKKSVNGKASKKHLVMPHHAGREDLEENRSDNDISILEVTSRDQLRYSKTVGAEKPGRIL